MLQVAEKEALYRILRESIYNSIRHGHANRVKIALSVDDDNTSLVIEDNGDGLAYEQVEKDGPMGLGIHNMKYLVQQLQGAFHLESQVGQGTKIEITL